MSSTTTPPPLGDAESNTKSILEWLALAHGRVNADDTEQLLRQLLLLRSTPIPASPRTKILDLLYAQTQRVVESELPKLRKVTLPVPRKTRQRVRILLELLETLTQDYFNTLADVFDPDGGNALRSAHTSLRRVMHTIAWQIRIYHLIAAPARLGLWQQLHAAYRSSRRLGIEATPGPRHVSTIQHIYSEILLSAIAQPASFSASELEFISDYIERAQLSVSITENLPEASKSVFWIDSEKDFPAHALARRMAPEVVPILYFACDEIARITKQHLDSLKKGESPNSLELPSFAATPTGQGVLRRLHQLWGNPAKRKFTRRRQSYRANICAGIDKLWALLKSPNSVHLSEWMVTNESPDGYSIMHIAGETEELRVGDIVAIQATNDKGMPPGNWHVCIIRWAISENPEHVELGLQVLAARAIAVEIARPDEIDSGHVAALILPEMPPVRMSESLVVSAGVLREGSGRLLILIESTNLEIREVRTTAVDEQTSAIEVFRMVPDESA